MSSSSPLRVRVLVHGRVQGVGYRAWTAEQARALGLSGWVRNLRDGRVEAMFSGDADAIDAMIARCHEGPPAARVDGVERQASDEMARDDFVIRPTGPPDPARAGWTRSS